MTISKQIINEVLDVFNETIEPAVYKVACSGWYGDYESITNSLAIIHDVLVSLNEQTLIIND